MPISIAIDPGVANPLRPIDRLPDCFTRESPHEVPVTVRVSSIQEGMVTLDIGYCDTRPGVVTSEELANTSASNLITFGTSRATGRLRYVKVPIALLPSLGEQVARALDEWRRCQAGKDLRADPELYGRIFDTIVDKLPFKGVGAGGR